MCRDDQVRLRHMLDAAEEAISFARGKSRSDLDSDRMLTLALVKSIEIIGEAAARVTPDGRAESPEIPWQDIIGMRNRLIHAYFDIDLDRVWDTVSDDLPPLVATLERIGLTEASEG
jgi:uncharacterized protein with HEPN domain